jgi:hypothetical protein
MVSVDSDDSTQQHRAEFAKGVDNAEQFFFNHSVVTLGRVQLARIICHWMFVLHDD